MEKQITLPTALWVLAAALGLGALADVLFRTPTLGLNAGVWAVALVAAICATSAHRRPQLSLASKGLLAVAVFFTMCLAWRDSPALKALDVFAAAVAISLALGASQRLRLAYCGLVDYGLAITNTTINALCGGAVIVMKYIPWADVLRGERSRSFAPVLRGLLLATPLLLIFGVLLASADSVFGDIVTRPLRWNTDSILDHGSVIVVVAVAAAGLIHGFLLQPALRPVAEEDHDPAEDTLQPAPLPNGTQQSFFRPGQITATETCIALGLLAAMFGLFVLIQVRYLFGGANLIDISPGLTYAHYARKGFFELVAASALALPVLLLFHQVASQRTVRERLCYSVPAGALVCLLLVVMVSAAFRMRLYTQTYGLTELRLYTNASIGWLGAVFFWFAATVLRGRRENFAIGTVVASFMLVFSLHALNPDDYIVKTNQALARQGVPFDLRYALQLSDDALPALVRLETANGEEDARIWERLRSSYMSSVRTGWRGWSYSRSIAYQIMSNSACC